MLRRAAAEYSPVTQASSLGAEDVVGDITRTCSRCERCDQRGGDVVLEKLRVEVSKRGGTRMDDKTSDASMEKRKKDRYF